ncbi:MAG: formyltransferase family protein [Candidatus Hydrogenedentota bacterium]
MSNATPEGPTATRVAVMGEQQAAHAAAQFLLDRDDTTVCALLATTPQGRANLEPLAKEKDIPFIEGELEQHTESLARMRLDYLFTFQHRRTLAPEVLTIARRGAVNMHLGALPRYAGWYPVVWAILNGEPEAGVTLHELTEEPNAGAILAQAAAPIQADTTARELFVRLVNRGIMLFRDAYPLLRTDGIRAVPQNLAQRTYYGMDSLDLAADSRIDWSASADEICRRIRAFTFKPYHLPGTHIHVPGGAPRAVTITGARVERTKHAAPAAGRVRDVLPNGELRVEAGDGNAVCIAQLDGRNPRAFLNALGIDPATLRFAGPETPPAKPRPDPTRRTQPDVGPYCTISDDVQFGKGVQVYGHAHLYGCTIGDDSHIGRFVEIQRDVTLGRGVRVQTHTFICSGVTLEDDVFIGHNVNFINDRYPTAPKARPPAGRPPEPIRVKRGASIGTGAVVMAGLTIGEGAVVGAGSVVMHDVPPHTIVAGVPACAIRELPPEDQWEGGERRNPEAGGESPA